VIFVDTNVLLYAVDERDIVKRDRSRQWLTSCWNTGKGRLSTQVLNEFYVNARKRFAAQVSPDEARATVRRYQTWKPWQIDAGTIETAWAVEARYGLSYWDALMVAAAQHLGCLRLLTEDLQHLQHFDSVQIINPFLIGPEILHP
jgi:predicted nucleic acid-binding protein